MSSPNGSLLKAELRSIEIIEALEEHLSEAEREGNHEWEKILRVFLNGMYAAGPPSLKGTLPLKLKLGVRS